MITTAIEIIIEKTRAMTRIELDTNTELFIDVYVGENEMKNEKRKNPKDRLYQGHRPAKGQEKEEEKVCVKGPPPHKRFPT